MVGTLRRRWPRGRGAASYAVARPELPAGVAFRRAAAEAPPMIPPETSSRQWAERTSSPAAFLGSVASAAAHRCVTLALVGALVGAAACHGHAGQQPSTSPVTAAQVGQSEPAPPRVTPCLAGQIPICISQSCSGCPCGGFGCADRECVSDTDCGPDLRCGCRGTGAYVCPERMNPTDCENVRCGGRVCRGASE